MQYQFQIQGIRCNSCVEKIKKIFQEQLNITKLNFNHQNTQIQFSTDSEITPQSLNALLAPLGDYTVTPLSSTSTTTSSEKLSYRPIYLIFGYLIGINLLLMIRGFSLEIFMTNFMASFFLVFSFFKLLDLKGFAAGYASYDLIAKRFQYYGYAYPFIELAFGIAYLLVGHNLILNIIVLVIMFISSVGVIMAKLSKRKFYCACVGTFLKVPLGSIAIIEDVTMVVMSLLMVLRISLSA